MIFPCMSDIAGGLRSTLINAVCLGTIVGLEGGNRTLLTLLHHNPAFTNFISALASFASLSIFLLVYASDSGGNASTPRARLFRVSD
ncbi:hypothetical protein DEU56DRAFT_136265 [Suillus clintonianus]|uniref:uncharacterized protein n=1 Tax=Suillus clintonianus TaxID=1904413 RepID=UPI001B87F263|nr:uncharacterized protein DEU56DRAFT_136265 [Suillus clintonianus]KAG2119303.1 hypothetical protein DEU56DRAFT_136265 [Suillus clintonianus]